jgi:hypothetical protein
MPVFASGHFPVRPVKDKSVATARVTAIGMGLTGLFETSL